MTDTTGIHRMKKVIFREHDLKKTTLRKIRHGYISIYDIDIGDLYKYYYITDRLELAQEYGYPVLIDLDSKKRLLIFNRPIC